MFTGIIKLQGKIKSLSPSHLILEAPLEVDSGESVAVDGVCLTLIRIKDGLLEFDLLPQTWNTTAFRYRRAGEKVNLELPATAKTFLSGHIVQGHVDGVGTVVGVRSLGKARRLKIQAPREVLNYLVEKGSVAVNGVSLTVSELLRDGFEVELIPETLKRTNLSLARPGYRVNLEADIIGKYVLSFLRNKNFGLNGR